MPKHLPLNVVNIPSRLWQRVCFITCPKGNSQIFTILFAYGGRLVRKAFRLMDNGSNLPKINLTVPCMFICYINFAYCQDWQHWRPLVLVPWQNKEIEMKWRKINYNKISDFHTAHHQNHLRNQTNLHIGSKIWFQRLIAYKRNKPLFEKGGKPLMSTWILIHQADNRYMNLMTEWKARQENIGLRY